MRTSAAVPRRPSTPAILPANHYDEQTATQNWRSEPTMDLIREFRVMNVKNIFFAVLFTTLAACGSDRDSIPLVQDSDGTVSISGDAVVGASLTASISDPDGVLAGSDTYQWYSDGDQIDGASAASYTLTQNEGGELVTVVARYTDEAGLRETVESDPVGIQSAFNLGD